MGHIPASVLGFDQSHLGLYSRILVVGVELIRGFHGMDLELVCEHRND
jgi:hypothetical protein